MKFGPRLFAKNQYPFVLNILLWILSLYELSPTPMMILNGHPSGAMDDKTVRIISPGDHQLIYSQDPLSICIERIQPYIDLMVRTLLPLQILT